MTTGQIGLDRLALLTALEGGGPHPSRLRIEIVAEFGVHLGPTVSLRLCSLLLGLSFGRSGHRNGRDAAGYNNL
jgi:hypothetical protein